MIHVNIVPGREIRGHELTGTGANTNEHSAARISKTRSHSEGAHIKVITRSVRSHEHLLVEVLRLLEEQEHNADGEESDTEW